MQLSCRKCYPNSLKFISIAQTYNYVNCFKTCSRFVNNNILVIMFTLNQFLSENQCLMYSMFGWKMIHFIHRNLRSFAQFWFPFATVSRIVHNLCSRCHLLGIAVKFSCEFNAGLYEVYFSTPAPSGNKLQDSFNEI